MVKINYPELMDNHPLKMMFEMQKALLKHYIGIESMPSYPIDISEKANQKLMKEFIRRGIEELSEAHETYQRLLVLVVLPNYSENSQVEGVLALNEEISDALHFFIEALIYADIGWADIDEMYMERNPEKGKVQPLQKGVELARILLHEQGYDLSGKGFNSVPKEETQRFFQICAGRTMSNTLSYEQAQLMWDVTHNFCLATNHLKNNDWKQSHTETDIPSFKGQMLKGWLALMNLLVHFGLNSEAIFLVYCHKNIINQKRIEEKR